MYSIICLFRNTVGPKEKFWLNSLDYRVLCLVWEIKGRRVLANLNNLGTLYLLLSIHVQTICEL